MDDLDQQWADLLEAVTDPDIPDDWPYPVGHQGGSQGATLLETPVNAVKREPVSPGLTVGHQGGSQGATLLETPVNAVKREPVSPGLTVGHQGGSQGATLLETPVNAVKREPVSPGLTVGHQGGSQGATLLETPVNAVKREPVSPGLTVGHQGGSQGATLLETPVNAVKREPVSPGLTVGHQGGSQGATLLETPVNAVKREPVSPGLTVGHQQTSQAATERSELYGSALDEQAGAEDTEPDDTDHRAAWSGYLIPADNAAQLHSAIDTVVRHCDSAERRERASAGIRARTVESLRHHHAQLRATVCIAAKCLMRGAPSFRVPMRDERLKGKRTRYTDPLLTINLRTALRLLTNEEFIVKVQDAERPQSWRGNGEKWQQLGRQAGYTTGPRLAPLLSDVALTDICRAPGGEIILLKSKRDDFGLAELVDYKRTPAAISAARAELAELNTFRAAAHIECDGDPARFDVSDRHTRRRWTRASWQCGGRHWGGFWQTMRKAERLNLVRIDGEPVIGLDYVGTIVTLAYAAVGQKLPEGDPYGFELADRNDARVATTRRQRKTIFIAAMNGAKEWPRELRKTYRHLISWRRTVECLSKAHPPIAAYLGADYGQELAYTEANIMAAVLHTLRLKGVVALDMFDCVLVKLSAVDLASEVMLSEFLRIAGQPAKVQIERPEDYPMVSRALQPASGEAWDF